MYLSQQLYVLLFFFGKKRTKIFDYLLRIFEPFDNKFEFGGKMLFGFL